MEIANLVDAIKKYDGRALRFMEVCGTHTSAIIKGGVRQILSPKITLVSGPGCPVCVTGDGYIDKLRKLALEHNAVVCSFGDMLKVPGKQGSLATAKAEGADIRVLYSPFDIIEMAKCEKNKQFVFAAVGFETIAPIYAMLVETFKQENILNCKLLLALKRISPALHSLCGEQIDGFIAPGHVAAVIGSGVFEPIAAQHKKPFCVAGFTVEQIVMAIYDLVIQSEKNTAQVHNLYQSVVSRDGNRKARNKMDQVYRNGNAYWRGLGSIADSGLYLSDAYAAWDAGSRDITDTNEKSACRCGDVIVGKINPVQCPLFGKACTTQNPQGPCMVSSEGACGIWYQCNRMELVNYNN